MQDNWEKHQLLVLSELRRLGGSIDELSMAFAKLDKDVAVIRVKSGIAATISATIVSALAILIDYITRR